jgi:hypothetical protein
LRERAECPALEISTFVLGEGLAICSAAADFATPLAEPVIVTKPPGLGACAPVAALMPPIAPIPTAPIPPIAPIAPTLMIISL